MGMHGVQHVSDLDRFFERTSEWQDGIVRLPDVPDLAVFFLESGGDVLNSYGGDASFLEFFECGRPCSRFVVGLREIGALKVWIGDGRHFRLAFFVGRKQRYGAPRCRLNGRAR